MPFHFSMQKILDYRQQLEEEAKVRLAQAHQRYLEEERRQVDLQRLLAEKEAELYQRLDADAGERWLLENFIKGLRADMTASLLRLRTMRQMVDEARAVLLERAKDRKVLEKLKEHKQAQYAEKERDKERKTNDETATLRYKAAAF